MYFNYHAEIKRLLAEGKLKGYYYTLNYNGIKPALVLLFDDALHKAMPVREYRWDDYANKLPPEKELKSLPDGAEPYTAYFSPDEVSGNDKQDGDE